MIRGEIQSFQRSLNGPQGNVAKTIESVSLLHSGFQRRYDLLAPMGYTWTNLLSCMTLDVENCHSVVPQKSPLCTGLEYARNFGNAVKESVKKTTNWAAFYYTNPKSWYPIPDRAAALIEMSIAPQLPPGVVSAQDAQLMREWAYLWSCSSSKTLCQGKALT